MKDMKIYGIILAVFTVLCLVLLCACGKQGNDDANQPTDTTVGALESTNDSVNDTQKNEPDESSIVQPSASAEATAASTQTSPEVTAEETKTSVPETTKREETTVVVETTAVKTEPVSTVSPYPLPDAVVLPDDVFD